VKHFETLGHSGVEIGREKKMRVCGIYFSPTNTTKIIVKTVFYGLTDSGRLYDATTPEGRRLPFVSGSEDVVLIGAPVYSGRLPEVFADYLREKDFRGKKVAALVVYGNRAYEDALVELKDIITSKGGVLIAAGAFIGEHSYTSEVAFGRPDAGDKAKAGEFARAIEKNISREISVEVPGNRPYRERRISHPMGPHTGDTCIQCHLCAEKCPVGAIDFHDSRKADFEKCLHCHRCIYSCPVGAKTFDRGMEPIRRWLVEHCSEKRLEPEWFTE